MDLLSLVGTLLRRWYVVAPILALTVLAALRVDGQVPPEYEARGWVLLESPALDATLESTSRIDVVSIADELNDERSADLPAGATFVVQRLEAPGEYGVLAAASTAQAAKSAAAGVIAFVSERVNQAEEGVGGESAVRVRLTTPAIIPEQQVDGSFTAAATMEVRDPAAEITNPYRADNGTGRILEVAINGDSGRRSFEEQTGGNVDFAVGQESRDSAALLQVATYGSDRHDTIEAFDTVREMLNEDLGDRQARAGVPESQWITVAVFDPPLTAIDIGPPLARATAAVIVLGGLLALAGGLVTDNLLRRRQKSPPTNRNGGHRRRPAPPVEAGSASTGRASGKRDSWSREVEAGQPRGPYRDALRS